MNQKLILACATVGVVTSFAHAGTPLLTDTSVAFHNAIFLFDNNGSGDPYTEFLPAVQKGEHVTNLGLSDPPEPDHSGARNALIGLLDEGDLQGVVVAMNFDSAKGAIGHSFFDVFHSNEADLIQALNNGDASAVTSFFLQNNPAFCDGSVRGQMVGFTDGQPLGIYQLNAVPEPASMAALGLGAIVLIRRKRSS